MQKSGNGDTPDEVLAIPPDDPAPSSEPVTPDSAPEPFDDLAMAHRLLEAAGASQSCQRLKDTNIPIDSVSARLVASCDRWLAIIAGSKGHQDGCQCHLCGACRHLLREVQKYEFESDE